MMAWVEWLAAALILVGAFFLLVGAVGLYRLPDFYMRLHAPTKASSLGVGGVLSASVLLAAFNGRAAIDELMIIVFLFVTAPVSANLMALAALHLRLPCGAPVPTALAPSLSGTDAVNNPPSTSAPGMRAE